MADVPYRAQQVVSTCQVLSQKSAQLTRDNTDTYRESFVETTSHLNGLLDEAQRAEYKAAMASMLKLHQAQKAYPHALTALQNSYNGSAQSTDFATVIKSSMDEALAASSFDVDEDPQMKEFCVAIGEKPVAGETAGDDDDDLMMTDTAVLMNEKCPLTAKSVFELKEPVQDEKGFIYEKQDIVQYIRNKVAKRGERVVCPVHGASHYVTVESLRKAPQVAREKRKRDMLAATQSQAGNGAGPSRNNKGTVLQVDEDDEEEEEDL